MTSRRVGRAALVVAALVPLAFLAIFFVVPVSGMALRGLRPEGQWALGSALEVLGRGRTQRVLWFTVWLAGLGTAVTVLLGVPMAYVLHRLSFRGQRVLRALVVMPFVLPTVVVGVAFRTLLAPSGPLGFLGLDGSWVAILLALIFFNLAVVVRTVGGMWESLDPRAEEAAAALGASPAQVFRTVTLPALLPSILSATSVVFLFCSTAFGVVLVLGGLRYSTIETEIYLLTANFLDLQAAAVLSLLQLVAVLALLGLTEAARTRRERVLSRVARTGSPRRPARADALPVALTVAAVAFLLTPILTLVVRSLRIDGAWSLHNYRQLAAPEATDALLVPVTQAMANSWRTAIDATLLAMLLGVLVAVVVSRRPATPRGRRALGALDATFMLPLGISAVTVGFGFLITLDRPPLDLRSSPVLVPIAQAMVALPLVVRTLAPVLRSLDPRQREAAASLGAGPVRAWLSVDLPVVWRPLLAATGFAMAVSLGEFGATSFLARPERPTLPVVIYTLIGRPGGDNFGMALAASVLLALVTVVIMGVVERLRVGSLGSF
ncbi:thiamine transport system permease protein [Barrientosiimonas humi]|uniref:Thiamine transport system permease protein n=1 Tax=Barrientosiimonas humi TaxID=999931 RepID=A0A542XFF2_9MICO|nr:iron ABC transporter permease [Barrientosiimonas humi]TQL34549.1 thiamine transport system permease protein [Barrientosiimonas humi]CAG7574539.1 Sulfate transport system permease protein CysW [Barrientosiimonas humi]